LPSGYFTGAAAGVTSLVVESREDLVVAEQVRAVLERSG